MLSPSLSHIKFPYQLSTLLLIAALTWTTGCTSHVSQKQMAKQEAIYQSKTAIISQEGARVINPDLDAIVRHTQNENESVLVVSWKSAESAEKYYNPIGSLDTLDSKYLTWVVQESQYPTMIENLRLDRLKGQKLALRLEQALGLPPTADTTRVFLGIRVRISDLFRPCRNPDVSSCACSLNFPTGYYSPDTPYLKVYEGLIESTQGYPWSRLGYTYDWSQRSRDHFGFSEYIIRQGAVVEIVGKMPTEEFIASFGK